MHNFSCDEFDEYIQKKRRSSMKQKLMSSIGGCLLLAFLLLAFPIRGQAADPIIVTDDDNGVKVQYELSQRRDSADTYSAVISFADEDATPEKLHIKSKVKDANGTSYEIRDIKSVAYKDSLESVKIEEGITSMAEGVWGKGYADSDTVTISFPSTLEDVEDGFLNWDKHPDSVIVPTWLSKMKPENGVVYAGKVAVYVPEAEKVSEITFKDGCTKIAHKALFKNTDVKKVNIPASVKAIGGAAFAGCTNLSQVNFAADAQIEDLDWRAFYDCTALTSIKIPDSVTRIGTETFSGCTSLATIDISKESKLTKIEYGAFGYYPYKIDLKSLGNFYDINPSGPSTSAQGVKVKEIYLPKESIKNYGGGSATGLFAGCTTLEKVTIGSSGDSKAELPYEMFAGCTNLKTVNMDKNVNTIGTAAFAECTGLKSIDLTGVKEIMPYAFTKAGLSEVTIPSSVEKIGGIAFGGCISLETMTLESRWSGEDSVYRRMVNILGNFSYVKGEYSYNMHTSSEQVNNPIRSNEEFREKYPGQTAIKTLIIKNDGEGTALDNSSAFAAHLVSLENVTLPEGMKTIPSGAFKQCFSLKKVVLPSSIETIGNNAFDSDVNLDIDFTKLTNLTSIGSQAFSIINANGGNSVGGSYDKKYTDEITDNGGIKNIILSESVKTIGSGAFFGQRNVKKIVIPEPESSEKLVLV